MVLRSIRWLLPLAYLFSLLISVAFGYQVGISDQDDVRQVCNGMYGGTKDHPAFIEVIFAPSSRGQLALVMYEWNDAHSLGVSQNLTGSQADNGAWSEERVYICTLSALSAQLCAETELGRFITNPPSLASASSDSSIFTSSVRFDPVASAPQNADDKQWGVGPYRYEVKKTGYYCVGAVPLTLEGSASASASQFVGVVDFENAFGGNLPAADYPKVFFFFILSVIYLAFAVMWIVLCYRHRRDLLPIQNYITATIIFLVIEMIAVWRYWVYLNDKGHPGVAGAYLVFVSVLNAARNSVSFFLLLIVSMGYSIVRPSLGAVMLRIRLLALVHFVFGILYSIGVVMIPLESASFFVFFFVLPLAFSLTAFLMWIMWSLNSTIADLDQRRQSFKKQMFTSLYRILVFAVIVIIVFFVISSLSFSYRLDDDFAPDTWKTQWILLDGWLSVLYMVCFFSIAWIWRPTERNRRLALSDELPTDELDADQYDVDAMATGDMEDEEDDRKNGESVALREVRSDGVVFDVGSDDDEEEAVGGHRGTRASGEGRPLKYEDSDEEGDIANKRSSSQEESSPPEYTKRD